MSSSSGLPYPTFDPPSGSVTFVELAAHLDDVVAPIVAEHFAACHGESDHENAAEDIRAAVIQALLEQRLLPPVGLGDSNGQ